MDGEKARKASAVLAEVMVALGEAQEGCMRVRHIVRDVKDFARLDVGELSVLDLPTVLDTAIRMTESLVRQVATVRREYAWTPHIEANAAQLGQVFMNLLVNAAQAIGAGSSKTKEIVVAAFTDASGRAVVEVRDSGPGISPEIQQRIFDPFFTTKEVGKGTGLGLSICHSIVSSFDGDLSMASELGKGATFRVTLAPVTDRPLPIEARSSATMAVAKRSTSARRKRILIVDDELPIIRALTRFLRRDYDLISASGAAEALDRISTDDAFDAVLCDLMMAGANGMQLYETLCKTNPELARKVVFLTGGASSPETQEFLRKSQNPTLIKPVDGDELLRFLADFTAPPSKRL
jgi:CheY-like chemotaxis protein/anti-sigma regulatory factor (Ser/Thr protein kinase)